MINVRENQTMNYDFCLLGFQILYSLKIPFFLLILILYIFIIIGNGMISALILSFPNLSHPMFFFLSHLSFCDITLTTTIVPIMLDGILRGVVQLSISACLAQFQIFCAAVASECFLLAAISFDRYLAICNPLQYVYIMRKELCFQLVILCWTLGCSITFSLTVLISKLEFCGPNIIDHFFCDILPILQLSCSDTSAVKLGQLFVSTTIAVFSIISIIVTYIYILITVFKIQSVSGRQKALSTCSSHMTVLGTFLGSLIGLYLLPSNGKTLNANKVLSLLYTVVTPLLNPIIYSLRNIEIRVAVKKSFKKMKL